MYENIIKILSTDDYYVVKKDINKLINDPLFMKKIVKVHNPIIFDRFIKMCEYKIDTSVLHEERNKFIKEAIDSLNKDNIYRFFELENIEKSRQDTIANRYLIEYIISYYFGDNYYNFMTNFYQMIKYVDHSKNELVRKLNIDLYKEFVNLRNMSFTDKIGFFKLLLDDNSIMEKFYDDMNRVKSASYLELTKNSLKLSHENDIYSESISKRLMVDVYILNGEDFFGFVRCLNLQSNDLSDHFDYVNSKDNRLGYSFSYIGKNNIGTIDYQGKNVTLFYDSIDYRNIMYVHHADLHAKKMNEQNDFLSEKENEILTPNSLIANTVNYNEIYIKSSEEGIKPTALVCYDSISLNDINFARKYDLAILVINRRKYKRYETHEDDYNRYTYNI